MSTTPPREGDARSPHPSEPGWIARVEAVYSQVTELPPRERDAAVLRLCADHPALLREVRSLLAVAGRMSDFLERPALGVGVDQLAADSQKRDEDSLIGASLGAFRVERRLASGGMGTVYLAARSDGQFEQKVAIKVVKRGMDSEEILRRFKIERQTLAALDHPNIARLIDGGATPDGRPFVVMEYIDGKPIDEYCDSKSLSLRDRLRLFREVCDGVHHAHQNLIIHRDIKPGNILVTAQGVPKLLDFGIAKVLAGDAAGAPGSHTSDTERRLTPEFASPEQIEGGPLTTASDVYSLGVVLYQLLTGIRPYYFGARTSEEVRRVVCTQMPLPPSEAITVKASRLPGTASAPPSSKAAHSGSLTASTLLNPAAATQQSQSRAVDMPKTRGVSSTRLRGILRGDLDIIVLMALRKEPHRRYLSAEQFSADIGRYLSEMPVHARKDTLVYRASKFVRRHGIGAAMTAGAIVLLAGYTTILYTQGRQLERQRADLIAANTRLDQSIKRANENRRFLQAVISGAETGNQGPDARLGEVLKDAANTLRTAPPADPLTLAASQAAMGRAMMSLGMLDEAQPLLEAADLAYAGLPGDDDARVEADLSLAELLFFRGKHADAERELRALLAAERARNANSPSAREGTLLNDLGAAVRLQNRAEEAMQLQREALRVRLAAHGENSLEVAETRNNLASALLQSGDTAAAVDEYTKTLETRKRLLRPEHPLVVRCQSNLGLAKLRLNQVDEAIELLNASITSWDRAFGPEHPGRIAAMKSLAQALRKKGRAAEALDTLNSALGWQRSHQPTESVQIAATEANIGITLAETGEDARASEILARVVPLLRGAPAVAGIARSAVETLAGLHERNGREQDARDLRNSLNDAK